MSSDIAYKSSMFGVWLQREGPNTQPVFLGCHELGDVTDPKGSITPVRCRNKNGKGWHTVQQLEAPPDNPGTSITTLLFAQRDLIEKIGPCPANLYILGTDCGDRSQFSNYVRGEILHNIRPTSRTFGNLQTREAETESTVAVEVVGDELLDVDALNLGRISSAEIHAANDIWVDASGSCEGLCASAVDPGDIQLFTSDSAVGPAKAKTYISRDGGETWTVLAADPGGAGLHLMGVTMFQTGRTSNRIIVCQEALGGDQGTVYLSDDTGATWTTVLVGGAAAGHGIVKGTAFFMPRREFGFIACRAGYIYKTIDAGVTWTAKEQATIHAGIYYSIDFADDWYGVAGGAADVIALSEDGGETWAVGTATGSGAAINCVQRLDSIHIWAGTANGRLYYSNDAGVTWTRRTGWVGDGIGQVKDLYFINELVGFMLVNNASPVGTLLRTIDGGYTWQTITTPANLGMNRLGVVDQDLVMAVGEPNATPLAVIIKGVAANQ